MKNFPNQKPDILQKTSIQQQNEHASSGSIIALFNKNVAAFPDAPAIVSNDQEISFLSLQMQSNHFLNSLNQNQIPKKSIVLINTTSRSILITQIFGTLNGEFPFLILDSSTPPKRLDSIIKQAQPSINISDKKESLTKQIYSSQNTKDQNCLHYFPATSSKATYFSERPIAYRVFTSGTSGEPKGVNIETNSLLNVINARLKLYPKVNRSILIGSITFDPSLLTILHTLLSGGTLYIPEPHVEKNVEATIQYLEQHSIDFLITVPSFYSSILQKAKSLPSLRQVVLGGEVLPPSLVELHEKKAPQAALNNEYGPTECAICTTVAKVYDPIEGRSPQITIGKPIDNMQVHILDENFTPVPKGEKGIIFISGVGVARGYINEPELTKKKFLEIDIEGKKTRVFRTGDYGRYLENGEIEFLGRIDNQVKIRGYRIELEEIESVLTRHPDIIDAVIVDRDVNGSKKLIGFYQGTAPTQDLRPFLAKELPDYMIPSKFVPLDQFPLTRNGKIDRKALRSLCVGDACSDQAVDPSDIKGTLFSIWKKILDHDSISPKDNFFDVGGDSLSVVELQESISKALGRDIPLTNLFQYPSIDQFTQYLAKQSPPSIEKPLSTAQKKKAVFQKLRKKRG